MSPLLSETRKTDNKKAPLLSTSRGAFLMFNLKKISLQVENSRPPSVIC